MRFVCFYLLLIFSFGVFGQKVFPVRSTLQVQYPSVFLDEYTKDGNMSASVSLLDPVKDDYNVLVKLVVTGQDVVFETRTPIAITLKNGQPFDLDFTLPTSQPASPAKLIDLNNINILFEKTSGSLLSTKTLPEGIYTMKLEIYDANFPTINVSNLNTIAATVFAQRLQPPLLNMPANNIFVEDGFPAQNLFFSWMPRSVVANPAIEVKYKFKLIEVSPGVDPYNAMNSAGSTYPTNQVEVSNLDFPSYQLSPEDLPSITFVAGNTYAWQISAYEIKDGEISTQRFTQNGRSEVYVFTIKENCEILVPTDITSSVNGEDLEFSWKRHTSHTAYEFSYRELGSLYAFTPIEIIPNGTQQSTEQLYTIPLSNLQRGMEYEFKVRAKCRAWQPEVYGGSFRIPDSGCDAPEPIRIDNTPSGVVLNWDAAPNVSGYKLRYRGGPTADDTETIIDLATATTYTLRPITGNQKYSIKLDAFCKVGGGLALGKLYSIAANSTGYAGGCPIPTPFNLINELSDNGLQTTLKWSSSSLHKSYKLEIVLKSELDSRGASATWREYTSSFPQQVLANLTNDVLYAYRITYICQNDQQRTTPVGYFKQSPNDPKQYINEGTGNCFPPAVYTAEGKSSTSANFEWDKSDNADKYQLFYAPKGTKDFEAFTTTQRKATIQDLGPNGQTIYKYKIRCLCADGKYSLFTDTATVNLNQRYTGDCTYDYPLKSKVRTKTNVRLAWKHTEGRTYVITYKEESQSINSFYTKQITNDSITQRGLLSGDSIQYTVNNLSPGTTYQFTMQPVCGTEQGKKTAPLSVTTLPDDAVTGGCKAPNLCNSSVKTLLAPSNLVALAGGTNYSSAVDNNKFQSGDISIVVLEPLTSDASGSFTGVGVAEMDLEIPGISAGEVTDHVRTNVAFKNIKINSDRCLIEGQVNVTSINVSLLDPNQQAKAQAAVDQFNKAMEQTKGAIGDLKNVIAAGQDAVGQAENYLDGGTKMGNVKTGDIRTPPAGAAYSVSGNNVTAGGQTIATLENDIAASDTVFCKKCPNQVTFSNPSSAKYDFDEYQQIYKDARKVRREYREIVINSTKTYFVPAKAMVAGQVDVVSVDLKGYVKEKIKFKTKKGVVYNLSPSNTLTLAGGPAGDGQDLYVIYTNPQNKDSIVGRLLVAQYPSVTKNLVLVKVDHKRLLSSTRMNDIKTATENLLRTTYNKIGINYNITIDESIANESSWDANKDGFVQVQGSGFLDNDFTGEEKALAKVYQTKAGSLDTNNIFLFVTPDGKGAGGDLNGKMPRGRKGGFIFAGNTTSIPVLAKTVLHELGHGPHTLHHLVNSDWIGKSYETDVENLMSYGAGGDLIKCQWDIMHDPGVVLGIFERDKDAEARQRISSCNYVFNLLYNIKVNNQVENGLLPKVYGRKNVNDISTVEKIVYPEEIARWRTGIDVTDAYFNGVHYDFINITLKDNIIDKSPNGIGKIIKSTSGTTGYLETGNFQISVPANRINYMKNYLSRNNHRLLLFVNGYQTKVDPSFMEYDPDASIYLSSPQNTTVDRGEAYWGNITQPFVERLLPSIVLFANGHNYITTSNHYVDYKNNTTLLSDIRASQCHFMRQNWSSDVCNPDLDFPIPTSSAYNLLKNKEECSQESIIPCKDLKLDDSPNVKGYSDRYKMGKEAAKNLMKLIDKKIIPVQRNSKNKIEDRLDIVCHSMGYAHAQGMIDYLKDFMAEEDGKHFGRFYILAPENGCSGSVNMGDFEVVWQYGTNEADTQEKVWHKDGVAPQCAVKGIGNNRAYIPKDDPEVPRGFVESHKVINFEKWIFKLDAEKNEKGAIPQRR